ncbi:MAG: hypothetical protein SCK70_05265 [bacterium]|nr:hypothetical protein [bacterium]
MQSILTNIKKISIPFFLIFILLFVFSCRNKPATGPNNEKYYENPFSWIGEEHNNGLSYVYDHLKLKELSRENKIDISKSLTYDFINASGLSLENFDADYAFAMVNQFYTSIKKPSDVNSFWNSFIENGDFTNEQKLYLFRIFDLLDNELSEEQLNDSLYVISSQAENQLDYNSSLPILASTSVLINSYEYWSNHIDEWQQLVENYSPPLLNKPLKFSIWSVVKWDVAGAVGGAAGGAIAGWLLGPGAAGTAAAGAVAGGVACSVADAVYQLLP